jgi:hypothetical protein
VAEPKYEPETPGSVLTYAEARQRSRLIDVLGYHVDLDVSGGEDVFGSVPFIRSGRCQPVQPVASSSGPARHRGHSAT